MSNAEKTISDVVWLWKDQNDQPSGSRSHVRRAVIQAVMMFGVSGFFAWKHHTIPCCIVGSLGVFVLISGLFIPAAFAAFEQFGKKLGFWIGTALTWLLLVPFFYICFPTMRLINTLNGKDPLKRKWEKDLKSYWINRPPITGPEHYTRQF